MAQTAPSPGQIVMSFAEHFASIYDELTGSISKIKQVGVTKLPDGTEVPNLVQESVRDPNATPICNETGARKIVHALRLVMNEHSMMGDLTNDEIAVVAGNTIRQLGSPMLANMQEYGITDSHKFTAEALGLFDALYIFLTSLRSGGVRGWLGDIYQIKVVGGEALKGPASQPQTK